MYSALSICLTINNTLPLYTNVVVSIPSSVGAINGCYTVTNMVVVILATNERSGSFFNGVNSKLCTICGAVSNCLDSVLSCTELLTLKLIANVVNDMIGVVNTLPDGGITGTVILTIIFIFKRTMGFKVGIVNTCIRAGHLRCIRFFSGFCGNNKGGFAPLGTGSGAFGFGRRVDGKWCKFNVNCHQDNIDNASRQAQFNGKHEPYE